MYEFNCTIEIYIKFIVSSSLKITLCENLESTLIIEHVIKTRIITMN